MLLKDISLKVEKIFTGDHMKAEYWVGILLDVKPVALTRGLFFVNAWPTPSPSTSNRLSEVAEAALLLIETQRGKEAFRALLNISNCIWRFSYDVNLKVIDLQTQSRDARY